MIETPLFDADAIAAGAVAKNGSSAVIEFVAGDERLWVTVPMAQLADLETLCLKLRALGVDAKNGVTNHWLVTVGSE